MEHTAIAMRMWYNQVGQTKAPAPAGMIQQSCGSWKTEGEICPENGGEDMLYSERVQAVLQQLQLKAHVTVNDLSQMLSVSVDTVRRDLKAMEQAGQIKCVRGGACLPESMAAMANFSGREIQNIEKKREASLKALPYIQKGQVVALNSGTTNTIFAQELIKRAESLTVVTNNIAAVMVLMQNPAIRVIVTGGEVDATERSLWGHRCEEDFASYRPDVAVLSVNAVSLEDGFTDFRFREAGIIRTLAACSNQVIVLMDSGKLGKCSKQVVLKVDEVDRIVMDDGVLEEEKTRYLQKGITIV